MVQYYVEIEDSDGYRQRFLQTEIDIHLPFMLVSLKKCTVMILKPMTVDLPIPYLQEKTERVQTIGNGVPQQAWEETQTLLLLETMYGAMTWVAKSMVSNTTESIKMASTINSSLPSFDVSDYEEIVLTYDRWLSVEDGFYDQATITMNGEAVWYNHASSENVGDEHHQDEQWQNHSILLDVDDSGQAQFSWEITSDRGLTMGGWTIDNVCVYGVPKVVETPLDGEDEEKNCLLGANQHR